MEPITSAITLRRLAEAYHNPVGRELEARDLAVIVNRAAILKAKEGAYSYQLDCTDYNPNVVRHAAALLQAYGFKVSLGSTLLLTWHEE